MRHLCGGAYVIRAHTASAPESFRLRSRALPSLQNVTDNQTDLEAVVLSTQLPGNGNYPVESQTFSGLCFQLLLGSVLCRAGALLPGALSCFTG